MLGSGSEYERHRLRVGLVVLMIGLAVLLGAVGMAILRAPSPTGDVVAVGGTSAAGGGDGLDPAQVEGLVPVLAALAGLLVVTLLVVAYALFRLTRRLVVPTMPDEPSKPTRTDDIWGMHQVPDLPPEHEAEGPRSGNRD
jgi:hypothetical protein